MKTSTFLKETIQFLDYEKKSAFKQIFICYALKNTAAFVYDNSLAALAKVDKLQEKIRNLLDGTVTLEHWLISKKGIHVHLQKDLFKRYETRLRWINSLIAEYEAKGD